DHVNHHAQQLCDKGSRRAINQSAAVPLHRMNYEALHEPTQGPCNRSENDRIENCSQERTLVENLHLDELLDFGHDKHLLNRITAAFARLWRSAAWACCT